MGRNTLLLLALAIASCAATPTEPEVGAVITLNEQQAEACRAGGGCVVIPRAVLQTMFEAAQACPFTRI